MSSAVAVLAGVGLAIAPVEVSDVRVSWPEQGTSPESTSLMLANQTPYALTAEFSDEAIRAAADGGGVLLSTLDPAEPSARRAGLLVTVTDEEVVVETADERTAHEWSSGDVWKVSSSTATGTAVTVDGTSVIEWPDVLPPQIDQLSTDATAAPPGALEVQVHVVDDYDNVPTPFKYGLMALLWVALAVTVTLLALEHRSRRAHAADRRARLLAWLRTLGPIDVAVVLGLAAWVFIGPMTDDDGYYAAMSLSYGDAGYVGNYYQMYNQPFAPFTWFWEFLYYWQELGGRSPVWLRVPALIAAVVAWFVVRTLLRGELSTAPRWLRWSALALLGLLFTGWWFAFSIGSRPEIVGAMGGVLVIALVLRAIRNRTLLPAFAAAVIAGLAFTAHPTGVVAFAPLFLSVPALWTIAVDRTNLAGALARTAAVLSAGAVALFVAFRDASLHDVLAGRATFSAVETPQTWMDEWDRYSFLMSPIAMGSYAKRALVLVALVLLVWFVLAYVFSRRANVAVPALYRLTGWSFALSLVLLWITPSKWTHHFGALAAVGPLMIVLVLALAPRLVAASEERLPRWLAPLVVASLVPPIVVGLSGPNSWAYSWNQGMFRADLAPGFDRVQFDSLALWGAIAGAVLVAASLLVRRRRGSTRHPATLLAAFGLVAVFATVSTGYLFGTFALSAFRGLSYYTPGGANLADPMAADCLIADSMEVWDARTATALATATGDARLDGSWSADGGWPDSDPLPRLPEGTAVWGSFAPLEDEAGTLSTPTYEFAPLTEGQRLVVVVGGSLDDEEPNALYAEYSASSEGEMIRFELDDASDQPGWRTMSIDLPDELARSGGFVRLVAEDATALPEQWIAVSSPLIAERQTLAEVVPADAATAVSWTSSFWFPCQRPMSISDGIIERPVMSTTWGDGNPDNIWVEARGGQMVAPARSATISVPLTLLSTAADGWGNVQLLDYDIAESAYDLESDRVTLPGWADPFGPTAVLIAFERSERR